MHLRVIPRKNDILKGFNIIRTLKLTNKIKNKWVLYMHNNKSCSGVI